MKIVNRYYEIIESRVADIISQGEKASALVSILAKKTISRCAQMACYCTECKHRPIAMDELVFDIFPREDSSLAVITSSCAMNYSFSRQGLKKQDYN